jgi:hypothetical protein
MSSAGCRLQAHTLVHCGVAYESGDRSRWHPESRWRSWRLTKTHSTVVHQKVVVEKLTGSKRFEEKPPSIPRSCPASLHSHDARAWLRWAYGCKMPNQALQVLRGRGHRELLANVFESSVANSTQSDLILQLAEERLDLSSLSLMSEERGLFGSLSRTLPYSFFDMYHQLLVAARRTFSLSGASAALGPSRSIYMASVYSGLDTDVLQLFPSRHL